MICKLFDRSNNEHITFLKNTLLKRNMPEEHALNVPQLSMIICSKLSLLPVAFGGLRLVEGDIAILDSYITDPDFASIERDMALDALTKNLIDLAKEKGIKKLISLTTKECIYRRARKHGLKDDASMVFQIKLL